MRMNTLRNGAFTLMTTLSVSPLAQSLGEVPPDNIIFGHSEAMQSVRSRLGKVAAANVPVLITGESGTGKD
ncbi:MAG: sigma 54-interacting transcriptional regulator, partial [Terriglobales bacterium]